MLCSFVCENLCQKATVWDKIMHHMVWMQNVIPWVRVTIGFGFFPTELKLLGRAVVSGASCGLEALLLSCVISQSSFKFSCNDAFLIHVTGFFFCSCAAWLGARTLCVPLSGVESLNPAMSKLSPDLGDKAYPISKLHCSGDLSQYFCMVLNWAVHSSTGG